ELSQRSMRIAVETLARDKGGVGPTALLLRTHFDVNLEVLQRVKAEKLAGAIADAQAFEMAQWASQSAAATALGQMSARFAGGTDALAALVRDQQDTAGEWRALDKSLVDEFAKSSGQRSKAREDAMRARLSVLDEKLKQLNAR